MPDAYHRRLDYLYGRLNYEWVGMPKVPTELRLGRMRRLMKRLGDPQLGLRIIHVAGTKGKGSTAAMIAAALTAAGHRTGLYCSPHLHRLEERYSIDDRQISADQLIDLVDEVRVAVDQLEADDPELRHQGATFFEITTAMALLYFARHEVNAVVLEVGMGGRLDSTNIVRPLISVITSIAFDHTRQLGNTLGAIAAEKAGILKRGVPAISGVSTDEPRAAIQRIAAQRRCPLREINVDFRFEFLPPIPPLTRPTPGQVRVETWRTNWGTMDLSLLGPHQAHNAAIALASLDLLAEVDPRLAVSRDAAAQGLGTLRWPARVEILGENPCLIVDGAHNVASAEALAETLRTSFPTTRRILVFGTTREKDMRGQLQTLLPLFNVVIATRYVENPRSVPAEEVSQTVREIDGRDAVIAPDPAAALDLARRLSPPSGIICVTGSLFLAAETRALLLDQENVSSRTGVVT